MMGRYSEELASHFKEMKTYIQCNVQGQKLAPRCEIQSYKFTLDVYNHAASIFHNRAFVAK
jgi:hypothetical protein